MQGWLKCRGGQIRKQPPILHAAAKENETEAILRSFSAVGITGNKKPGTMAGLSYSLIGRL
ncbi:hypothetical protein ABIB57_004067 [Devosia sp. UYZn731]|uniref:hypothetical protein n=1 Tax=Devosia sp. UYZn731 TaxID=3156345 RepID=UPI00339A561D